MHLKYITVRRSASMMFTMFLYSLSRQLFRLCSAYSSTMPLHHNHHYHYLTQITNIIIVIITFFIIVISICITISCNCVVLVPVPDSESTTVQCSQHDSTYFVRTTVNAPVSWLSNQAQSWCKMALKSSARRRETCRSDVSFQHIMCMVPATIITTAQ